jgi:hypothetical protein
VFKLATDAAPGVRREVCIAFCQLTAARPDLLEASLPQLIEYMLASNQVGLGVLWRHGHVCAVLGAVVSCDVWAQQRVVCVSLNSLCSHYCCRRCCCHCRTLTKTWRSRPLSSGSSSVRASSAWSC